MTREEAAAKALTDWYADEPWRHRQDVKRVLAAADAHDLAHGVHRIVLDAATVERASEGLLDHWWHYGSGKCACGEYVSADPRIRARHLTRAVLSAAVQEERK